MQSVALSLLALSTDKKRDWSHSTMYLMVQQYRFTASSLYMVDVRRSSVKYCLVVISECTL